MPDPLAAATQREPSLAPPPWSEHVYLCFWVPCCWLLSCINQPPPLRTYQDILDWQKSHCDATMVLHTGSCLSLALRSVVNTRMFIAVVVILTGMKMMKYSFIRCFESSVWYWSRLLKAAAGFPSSSGEQFPMHQVRRTLVPLFVTSFWFCVRNISYTMYTATWHNLSLSLSYIHIHLIHKYMHTPTTIHISHSCTQETWAKRLSYIQVVVELVADASHRKETHSHSYSDPISHLFQTAVDVCVLGTNIFFVISSPTPDSFPVL